MPAQRIYVIAPRKAEAGKPVRRRLVRATHPAHALKFVADGDYSVAVASQQDLIDCYEAGSRVEEIGQEQAELPST